MLLIATIATLGSAHAATISVNFSSSGADPVGNATSLAQTTFASTAVVGVEAVSNWNQIVTSTASPTATSGTLVDNAGASTTLSLTSAMNFTWSDINNPSNDTARLLNGQIGISNGQGTVTVASVPYAAYDVIVYFSPNNAAASSRAGISATGYAGPTNYFSLGGVNIAGSRNNFMQATGTTNATATTGANYARFNGLTASTFTLQLQDGGTDDPNNEFFGFQVVQVPEPSVALLGGLGMLCFLRRRRA